MDGRYMEPGCGVQDTLAWVLKLLRNENGVPTAGDGARLIFGDNAKKWRPLRLDGESAAA